MRRGGRSCPRPTGSGASAASWAAPLAGRVSRSWAAAVSRWWYRCFPLRLWRSVGHGSSGAPVEKMPRMPERGPGLWRQGWTIYLIGVMALMSFVPESAVLDWSALYLSSDHGAGVAGVGNGLRAFLGLHGGCAVLRRRGAQPCRRGAASARFGRHRRCGNDAGRARAIQRARLGRFRTGRIGLANLVPILFSAAGRQGGTNPGAAIAAVSFIGYGGMLTAPSVIGVTAEQVGFPAIFLGLSALLLAVAALAPVAASAAKRPWVPSASRRRAADGCQGSLCPCRWRGDSRTGTDWSRLRPALTLLNHPSSSSSARLYRDNPTLTAECEEQRMILMVWWR